MVGAGLAGLTAAREIARRGWSVALVEARRIAWNASGRNTGFVLPGFAQPMDTVTRRVGLGARQQCPLHAAARCWVVPRVARWDPICPSTYKTGRGPRFVTNWIAGDVYPSLSGRAVLSVVGHEQTRHGPARGVHTTFTDEAPQRYIPI